MNVELVGCNQDPTVTLYEAFRVCYSALPPEVIRERIETGKISREEMMTFLEERLETGHTSPMRQITFEFTISGVSRALTHQLVRHTVGWNFEQQSQRYVNFTKKGVKIVMPKSIEKLGFKEKVEEHNENTTQLYKEMVEAGVPLEDARYIFPNAAISSLRVAVNLLALQHFIDIRTCQRAQWEIRDLAIKMRVEVVKEYPWMAEYFGIKCFANRMGYCDEAFKDYQACTISQIRPHKSQVIP